MRNGKTRRRFKIINMFDTLNQIMDYFNVTAFHNFIINQQVLSTAPHKLCIGDGAEESF